MERHVLDRLDELAAAYVEGVDPDVVLLAIAAEGRLGGDQAEAVQVLCGAGPCLRNLLGPPGFGKTTMVHAAAAAQRAAGRPVLGLATTNKAVAELRDVGLPAMTLARLRMELEEHALA